MQKSENKVFLDANVLIAAALSSSGGSFRIIQEAPLKQFQLFTSQYALDEVVRNLKVKYPAYLNNLVFLFLLSGMKILNDASKNETAKAMRFIDFKDAPILATALRFRMSIIVTLDQKHFFTPILKQSSLPLVIVTPSDFIKKYFVE